jgi:hypothetical protein
MIERLRAQYPHIESQLFVGKYNRKQTSNLFFFVLSNEYF